MSGGDGALRTAGGGDIGFQGFVQKPFRIADLLSRVERLVGAARRR
jgi:DNA-binding response OmpR family regulator